MATNQNAQSFPVNDDAPLAGLYAGEDGFLIAGDDAQSMPQDDAPAAPATPSADVELLRAKAEASEASTREANSYRLLNESKERERALLQAQLAQRQPAAEPTDDERKATEWFNRELGKALPKVLPVLTERTTAVANEAALAREWRDSKFTDPTTKERANKILASLHTRRAASGYTKSYEECYQEARAEIASVVLPLFSLEQPTAPNPARSSDPAGPTEGTWTAEELRIFGRG